MSYNPVIIIPGIGQSKVNLLDKNGNKIKSAWPVELDEKALLGDIKSSLMKMMIFRKDNGFSDKAAKIVDDITAPLALNEDGTKKNNVSAVLYEKSVAECTPDERRYIYKMVPMEQLGEKIGDENLFFFSFDPFGDLYDVAKNLDSYVSMVKKKTGSEKVDFICVSLGGVVLRAYLQKYGEKCDVEKVVNVVAALDGTQLVADIFENKLLLDNPAEMLKSLGGKAESMASMVGMLPPDVVENTINKSLLTAQRNLIFSCTMMWGLIPNDRFDAVFNERLGGKGNSVLESKVKEFHDYTMNFSEEAKKLSEKGMKFSQLCGFGNGMIGIVESKDLSSDSIINISSASFGGAQCLKDEEIDISSCVFPDSTWFFKKQYHNDIAYNDVALSLILKIITGEISKVTEDPVFPQFNGTRDIKKLKYNLVPKAIKSLDNAPEATQEKLRKCLDDYYMLIEKTIIENNDEVKALESEFSATLEGIES